MDRRDLITGVAALAACAALPRDAIADDDLIGLPLAAKYGRLAAQAMALPGIGGRWEMAILSGDAHQPFGFAHIGATPIRLVEHRAKQLRCALQQAYGGEFSVVSLDDQGTLVRVKTGGRS